MTTGRSNPGGVLAGSALSALLHLAIGGGLYGWLALRAPARVLAELDLSMSPLIARPPNAGGGRGARRAQAWTLRDAVNAAPAAPQPVETREEVRRQEDGPAPCEGSCPAEDPAGKGWGGGTGEGDGEFIPAEAASRGPRWLRNFITSSDYPLVARREGKDGRVLLSVWIGRDGRVVEARVLEGSYDVLNEVAVRKVKQAVFSPAYDSFGGPVSCKITLPIRFELR